LIEMNQKKHKSNNQPPFHGQNLEWKQSLNIISIILIVILISVALLQIKIHKGCWSSFRSTQFKTKPGRVLFTLFIIGFISFLVNSAVFANYIFNVDDLNDDDYANNLIWSSIPYKIGKCAMCSFFIFRLHFIFKGSALCINKWIIMSLLTLSFIGTILGCLPPFFFSNGLFRSTPGSKGVSPPLIIACSAVTIIIFVDAITMVLYVRNLMKVVLMQAEVTESTKKIPATNGTTSVVMEMQNLEEQTDSSTPDEAIEDVKELYVRICPQLVNTITKSTLLSLVGMSTSFWLHIEMLIDAFEYTGNGDSVNYRAVMCLDGSVNLICMYLIFSYASPYYNVGCKWCHIGMSGLYQRIAKRAALKATKL